jgi:hypothetical protein
MLSLLLVTALFLCATHTAVALQVHFKVLAKRLLIMKGFRFFTNRTLRKAKREREKMRFFVLISIIESGGGIIDCKTFCGVFS